MDVNVLDELFTYFRADIAFWQDCLVVRPATVGHHFPRIFHKKILVNLDQSECSFIYS